MRKLAIICLLLLGCSESIQGTCREKATNQPMADVEVGIAPIAPDDAGIFVIHVIDIKTVAKTDSHGSYKVTPTFEPFRLWFRREGFQWECSGPLTLQQGKSPATSTESLELRTVPQKDGRYCMPDILMQPRAKRDGNEEYRFQIDGSSGFRVLEPVTFESDAHDLELIATIHPAINKNWELVGVLGYIGDRGSVDKPDMQMKPIPSLEDDAPQYSKKRRFVFLHDIKKNTQYTLAFRFHIRPGSETKTTARNALKFLTDYPSAFAVTIDEQDSTQP